MALNFHSLGELIRTSLRVIDRFRTGSGTASAGTAARPGKTASRTARPGADRPAFNPSPAGTHSYPGDFQGRATVRYAPDPDGAPDPGEVVWAWVPYEEDHTRGKDRPVLLIGHSGRHLLGLMLTSRDHDQDARGNNDYVDIGTGAWDRQSRPSEANLRRILQLSPDSIRREGAVLDRARFDLVAAELRRRHGWT